MLGFLWLAWCALLVVVFVALCRRGYPQRALSAIAGPVRSALRWSVRPLFALACAVCLLGPSSAQSTYVDTNRTTWNPANWAHNSDGTLNPCMNDGSAYSGPDSGYTNVVGPSGEPSPCTFERVGRGYMQSDGPAIIKAVLSVLVVILAIWQGPRVLKKWLLISAH